MTASRCGSRSRSREYLITGSSLVNQARPPCGFRMAHLCCISTRIVFERGWRMPNSQTPRSGETSAFTRAELLAWCYGSCSANRQVIGVGHLRPRHCGACLVSPFKPTNRVAHRLVKKPGSDFSHRWIFSISRAGVRTSWAAVNRIRRSQSPSVIRAPEVALPIASSAGDSNSRSSQRSTSSLSCPAAIRVQLASMKASQRPRR